MSKYLIKNGKFYIDEKRVKTGDKLRLDEGNGMSSIVMYSFPYKGLINVVRNEQILKVEPHLLRLLEEVVSV